MFFFQIFDFGVIKFDNASINQELSSCLPTKENIEKLDDSFLALYWIPTSITQGEGKIFYRMEDFTMDATNRNKTCFMELVEEINTAIEVLPDESRITIDQCLSAIYITWFNMKTFSGVLMNVSKLI